MGCSVKTGKVRDESITTISGEHPRKGTTEFQRLQPPRLDSFLRDDPLAPELLLVYSTASGMA
jgi:hypothetical protein